MKFRKRITIIPGVRLNLSRSGVSVTGGVPGLSVNVGKQGAYLNTGVPGTGLYDRTRLDTSALRRGGGTSGAPRDGGGASLLEFTGDQLVEILNLAFRVTEDGTVGTFLPDGEEVVDPRILRKVRRSAAFRAEAESLRESFVEAREREMAEILEVHHRTPPERSATEVDAALAEPAPVDELPKRYGPDPPARADIAAELGAEARRTVSWWPFWSASRRRAGYVQERLEERVSAATARWREEKAQFDRDEAVRVAEVNRRARERYDARVATLRALRAGDADAIGRELETRLAGVSYPLPFDIDFGVDDDGTVVFDVDMPEIEDMPDETARILASGKLSVKSKSTRQREREYATAVAALALFVGGHAFAAGPTVAATRVRGFTQQIDPATGREIDVPVVDVTFTREPFTGLRLDAGKAVAMVEGFAPAVSPGEAV